MLLAWAGTLWRKYTFAAVVCIGVGSLVRLGTCDEEGQVARHDRINVNRRRKPWCCVVTCAQDNVHEHEELLVCIKAALVLKHVNEAAERCQTELQVQSGCLDMLMLLVELNGLLVHNVEESA